MKIIMFFYIHRPGYAHTDKVKFKVSAFLGIPYAMPPTGEARLMPPRPHRYMHLRAQKCRCKVKLEIHPAGGGICHLKEI
jgi:hypothetical protein